MFGRTGIAVIAILALSFVGETAYAKRIQGYLTFDDYSPFDLYLADGYLTMDDYLMGEIDPADVGAQRGNMPDSIAGDRQLIILFHTTSEYHQNLGQFAASEPSSDEAMLYDCFNRQWMANQAALTSRIHNAIVSFGASASQRALQNSLRQAVHQTAMNICS